MNNKGSAFFTTLVIIVMVSGLAAAYIGLAISQNKTVSVSEQMATTEQMAYAGLNMARVVLLNGHGNGWDDELVTCFNNIQTYDPADPAIVAGTDTGLFQWARNIAYHDGGYYVTIQDNDDGDSNLLVDSDDKVVVYASAVSNVTGEDDLFHPVTFITLARYKPPVYEPDSAILSGGDMQINGNPTITGEGGTIIVDGNVDIGGNAIISQDIVAVGDIDITGSPTIGGDQQEFADPPDIPPVTPSNYYNYRDYRLAADGKVYDPSETEVWDTVASGAYKGWIYDGTKWTITPSSGAPDSDYTYYIEGDAKISGSPGTVGVPWRTTLIVEGYLDISGSPKIAPNEQATLFIVGGDIDISGANYQQTEQALLAAHEQISIKGTSQYLGSILAEDAEDSCNLVTTSSELTLNVSGNPTVTYHGAMTTILEFGDPAVVILGIKQIRGGGD